MTTLSGVPTLDLSDGFNAKNVEVFGRGLEDIGFVNVIGHGVSKAALARAYDVSKKTFDLPLAVKQKYEDASDGRATGYTSPEVEKAVGAKLPDLKEFWHVRRNVPPENLRYPAEVPEFGEVTSALTAELDAMAFKLLTLLEAHLHLAPTTLTSMVKDGPSLLRLLHYYELQGPQDAVRAEAHTDINLITALPASTRKGLEVQRRDGVWLPINNPVDSIIINAGDMLKMFSEDRLQSTMHQVVNGDGKPRYSMPYFIHPRPEVLLRKQPPYTAGEYLADRLREIGLLAE